jgi:hypothetical protein
VLRKFIPLANVHSKRHTGTCYKYSKKNSSGKTKLKCRFRFPRKLEPCTRWTDKKQIRLRRHSRWVNAFNSTISACTLCNTDGRFLLSGPDAKGACYYCTDYITKRALTTCNLYTLTANAVRKHDLAVQADPYHQRATDAAAASRSLIVRSMNAFTAQQERSAPEVANILLGNRDHFPYDYFVPLYLPNWTKPLDRYYESPYNLNLTAGIWLVNNTHLLTFVCIFACACCSAST